MYLIYINQFSRIYLLNLTEYFRVNMRIFAYFIDGFWLMAEGWRETFWLSIALKVKSWLFSLEHWYFYLFSFTVHSRFERWLIYFEFAQFHFVMDWLIFVSSVISRLLTQICKTDSHLHTLNKYVDNLLYGDCLCKPIPDDICLFTILYLRAGGYNSLVLNDCNLGAGFVFRFNSQRVLIRWAEYSILYLMVKTLIFPPLSFAFNDIILPS